MRNVLTMGILLGLLFAVGCGEINVNIPGIPGLQKSEPEKEPSEPAESPARKETEEYQPRYLAIFIDAQQTNLGEMVETDVIPISHLAASGLEFPSKRTRNDRF